jgi:hypothetical protein
LRALLLTLALAATAVGAGEVYRSVAPDGTVIYSDVPEGPNAEPIYVAVPRAASQPAPRPVVRTASTGPASPGQSGQAPAAASQAAAQSSGVAKALPTAEDRAKKCETARQRAESYGAAHRLFRTLPNGEREYLSDAEIDEAKAKAAADVEASCK